MTEAEALREEIDTLDIEIRSLRGRIGSVGGTSAQEKKLRVLIRVRDRSQKMLFKREQVL